MPSGRYDSKYIPGQNAPYKISRSKIDLWMECPRCFWLDRIKGIKRPSSPPFQINKAIDELLKKEFDKYRELQTPHPWMDEYNINAVPYKNKDLDKWRENFVGIQYLHEPTNLLIYGAIDDVWVTPNGELIIVDYKATSKKSDVNLDADWQRIYKRQLEIYQWLFEKNGYKVKSNGYFVYANGNSEADGFYNKVEFKTKLISYDGNTDWIEPAIDKIKQCLNSDIPEMGKAVMGGDCEHCTYAKQRTQMTLEHLSNKKATKTKNKL